MGRKRQRGGATDVYEASHWFRKFLVLSQYIGPYASKHYVCKICNRSNIPDNCRAFVRHFKGKHTELYLTEIFKTDARI